MSLIDGDAWPRDGPLDPSRHRESSMSIVLKSTVVALSISLVLLIAAAPPAPAASVAGRRTPTLTGVGTVTTAPSSATPSPDTTTHLPPVVGRPGGSMVTATASLRSMIDDYRVTLGRATLLTDGRLDGIARARAQATAKAGTLNYQSDAEMPAWSGLTAAGVAWQSAAETQAWNRFANLDGAAQAAFDQWRGVYSQETILSGAADNFTHLGLGTADGSDGRHYWVALFVRETPPGS